MASEAGRPRADVPLAPLTTLRVGGSARWFVRAERPEDVVAGCQWAHDRGLAVFVLGGGSNLVVADSGIDGLVLQVAIDEIAFRSDGEGTVMRAGAGRQWDACVDTATARGLAGLECLSGIPGTVGGTPVQNVGAYGQDVSQTLASVEAFDLRSRSLDVLPAEACGLSYRWSRFKGRDRGRYVVTAVSFRLRPGPPTVTYPDVAAWLDAQAVTRPTVDDVRRGVLAIRRRKGMVLDESDPDTRSVGSFFMNPIVSRERYEAMAATGGQAPPAFPQPDGRVKVPAAWLIERTGFSKGHTCGRVGLSTKHPLALINRGDATAREIVGFGAEIARRVRDRFGVRLRPEPVFAGFTSDPDVDSLLRDED